MPHLISAGFLRRKELRQHQNHRRQQSLCRIIEVGILSPVGPLPLRVDDGLGQDLGVLFRLGLGCNILWILPIFVHVSVDQGQQVVSIRPGRFPEIHHGNPVSVGISGDGAVVSGQVALGIQRQKAHATGTGIFQVRVQEIRRLTHAGGADHHHMNVI